MLSNCKWDRLRTAKTLLLLMRLPPNQHRWATTHRPQNRQRVIPLSTQHQHQSETASQRSTLEVTQVFQLTKRTRRALQAPEVETKSSSSNTQGWTRVLSEAVRGESHTSQSPHKLKCTGKWQFRRHMAAVTIHGCHSYLQAPRPLHHCGLQLLRHTVMRPTHSSARHSLHDQMNPSSCQPRD